MGHWLLAAANDFDRLGLSPTGVQPVVHRVFHRGPRPVGRSTNRNSFAEGDTLNCGCVMNGSFRDQPIRPYDGPTERVNRRGTD